MPATDALTWGSYNVKGQRHDHNSPAKQLALAYNTRYQKLLDKVHDKDEKLGDISVGGKIVPPVKRKKA
jgi:hypothetical protein